MNWINVNDRLPEMKEEHHGHFSSNKVLVYSKEAGLFLASLCTTFGNSNGKWFKDGSYKVCKDAITHWTMLPDKPKC
jgi:hypothetical protein